MVSSTHSTYADLDSTWVHELDRTSKTQTSRFGFWTYGPTHEPRSSRGLRKYYGSRIPSNGGEMGESTQCVCATSLTFRCSGACPLGIIITRSEERRVGKEC